MLSTPYNSTTTTDKLGMSRRQFMNESDLADLGDAEILGRCLTVTSVISTTSSFARRFQQAAHQPDLQPFQTIGQGLQGIIFEQVLYYTEKVHLTCKTKYTQQVGRVAAIKKELPGNDTLRSNLKNEFRMHQKVLQAFAQYEYQVNSKVCVPQLFTIVDANDSEYWKDGPDFPPPHQTPGTMIEMERIIPLPKIVRRALISHFHPGIGKGSLDNGELVEEVLNNTPNKHCLVRTYLGRKTGVYTTHRFSLRNFPLHLQSIERLGLDTNMLSSCMGKAFAMMHWGAGINGDDVEFVLGTSALDPPTSGSEEAIDFQQRAINFYLLDFGQCDEMDMAADKASVYQAFKGAMVTGDNQLFIPNCIRTPELFNSFKSAYIYACNIIVQDRGWQDKFNAEEFMAEYEEYAEDFL